MVLRMFFCDSQAVVLNASMPESNLKEKQVDICYHRIREACAMGMLRIATEGTKINLAAILTKILPGPTLTTLVGRILYE